MSFTPAEIARYDQLIAQIVPELNAMTETWRRLAVTRGETQATADIMAFLQEKFSAAEMSAYLVAAFQQIAGTTTTGENP